MGKSAARRALEAQNGESTTPTVRRIIDVLSDGLPHFKHELHACLDDELSQMKSIKQQVTYVRQHIRPKGLDVICQYKDGKFMYRMIRIINFRE